jgi:hypothetical protein
MRERTINQLKRDFVAAAAILAAIMAAAALVHFVFGIL